MLFVGTVAGLRADDRYFNHAPEPVPTVECFLRRNKTKKFLFLLNSRDRQDVFIFHDEEDNTLLLYYYNLVLVYIFFLVQQN